MVAVAQTLESCNGLLNMLTYAGYGRYSLLAARQEDGEAETQAIRGPQVADDRSQVVDDRCASPPEHGKDS